MQFSIDLSILNWRANGVYKLPAQCSSRERIFFDLDKIKIKRPLFSGRTACIAQATIVAGSVHI